MFNPFSYSLNYAFKESFPKTKFTDFIKALEYNPSY